MSTTAAPVAPQMPSGAGLLKRVVISMIAAAVILALFILPAEYGIDPTGLGERMGLRALAQTAPVTEDIPLAPPETAHFYPAAFHSNVIEVPLDADGEIEYKLRMKAGESVVYSWSVDNGKAYYDFHAESEPGANVIRYKEDQEGASADHGALTAPFNGIHGWYWLNLEGHPIVITLRVSGYYQLRPEEEQPGGVVKE
jgi:hypothetical protein